MVNYDAHYALRICREKSIAEACVQLSCLLGLWETAVDLALLVSLDLAKQTASQTPDDTELGKKLWLKIGSCSLSVQLTKISYLTCSSSCGGGKRRRAASDGVHAAV